MAGKKAFLFGLGGLILSVVLALAVAAGPGVGQNGYTVGTVSMSPSSSACIGGTLSLSGSGANPGDVVSVHLIGVQGVYEAMLGTATVDSMGNWSLSATIPYTVNVAPTSGGGTAATITGTWEVGAHVTSGGSAGYVQIGTISLVDCATALPKTGPPFTSLALAGSVGLTAALAAITLYRTRRTR